MRGDEKQQPVMFSYVDLDQRVPAEHPLRAIRRMVDQALADLSLHFDALYARRGRPSIPPEQLLRALLLQALFALRSERQLMEQIDFNLLYRWFVGLGMDEQVWDPTVFTKNRDRLLAGEVSQRLLAGGGGAGAGAEPAERRTLHGGWNAAGGVGESQQFRAQGTAADAGHGSQGQEVAARHP